jgi:hypothetical protein
MNDTCREHETGGRKPSCPICKRLGIEAKITRRLIGDLLKAGAELDWHYGDDEPPMWTRDRQELEREAMAADEAWLRVKLPDGRTGSVFLVYGNSGWDLITDYNVNLEPELAGVSAYAETFDK